MRKLLIPIVFLGIITSGAFIGGCYTDTIDSLSTFTFQLPLLFHSTHFDKAAPDTSYDFVNLHKYKEYRDNRDRISKALILHFNYWIDAIKIRGDVPPKYALNNGPFPENDPTANIVEGKYVDYFDKETDELEFEYIRFWLHFARLAPGYTDEMDTDSAHWDFDPNEQPYMLGEYRDVDIQEYYRNPEHIVEVSDEVAAIISEAVKNRPAFWIITEYSPVVGQDINEEPKRYFPFVSARYDMVIRFAVDL